MNVDVAALYDEGLGIRSVAEEIGRCYSTARRRLLAAGVELRKSGGRPLEPDLVAEYLASLYKHRRLSLRAIQDRTGYGYSFIRTRLLAAGVELRDRQGRSRKAVAQ